MSMFSRPKFLSLLLWGLVACLLCGCTGSADPSVTDDTIPPPADGPAATEAATDDPSLPSGYTVTDTAGENGLDFIIDFPAGEEITILQITDTQMQTMADVRNENRRGQISNAFFSVLPDDLEFRVFRYVDEAVEKTKPDLIVLTGDNIYGELDDFGRLWKQLIARMDSYEIPWCVVFGNHDNESAMGVQWQVAELLKSEYCIFKQGDVSGNSNYNLLIRQGGEAKYLLYMLDTNGCTVKLHNPGESLMPDNPDIDLLVQTAGLQVDQINWMYKSGRSAREAYGQIPTLMFMHIPPAESAQIANGTYGSAASLFPFVPNREGDFGTALETIGGVSCGRFWKYAQSLDCEGIFVGHQHKIATSILCDGIRVTYGLKTGTCDYHAESLLGSTKITLGDGMTVTYVPSELPYNP